MAKTLLHGWTPKTEHLLLYNDSCRGRAGAYDIIDHAFDSTFPIQMLSELRANGWIGGKKEGRLSPARTALDVNMQALLGGYLDIQNSTTKDSNSNNIRGDESVFISREERSQSDFPMKYPCLHRLICSIENSAVTASYQNNSHSFRPKFEFDTNQTSVQLARYCGDGKSGYPRHCDRGMSCAKEYKKIDSKREDEKEEGRRLMQRLLTFVYYLTPSDWDAEFDGGALRIYTPTPSHPVVVENSGDEYFDVTPHSGRLLVFRSDLMEHEVMPSKRRERIAITVWLYGRRIVDIKDGNGLGQQSLDQNSVAKCSGDGPINSVIGSTGEALSISNPILPPPLPVSESESAVLQKQLQEPSIFVAIPSYRDIETFPTIKSLIETSCFPQRVYIGVVFQVDTSSNEELERFTSVGRDYVSYFEMCHWNKQTNLRTITMDHRHSTGPCYARQLSQSLHRGEDYILQIDSHMRFRPNWDVYLIHQLHQCPVPSASVLTTYPPNYDPPNGPGLHAETRGTILVPWKFDETDGMLRQKGRLLNNHSRRHDNNGNSNIPCRLFAAGFNFFQSSLLDICPYDGKLHGLFFGEEISMAVRLFTSGVDLYAPPQTVCYHMWKRNPLRKQTASSNDSNTVNDTAIQSREASLNMVRMQLRGEGRGLGTIRTAKQFEEAIGVDFKTLELSKGCENAGLDDDTFVVDGLVSNEEANEYSVVTENDMSMVISLVGKFMGNA